MSQNFANEPPLAHSTVHSPEEMPPRTRDGRGVAAAIWSFVPTLAVVGALATLGYFGHRTGWRLPAFAELTGAVVAKRDDWCEEHGVPESACIECDVEQFPRPTDHGWCDLHGVHQCVFENPDVAQVKERPRIGESAMRRALVALELRPRPANNPVCTSYRRRIQFASHGTVLNAGIDVEPVSLGAITESVSAAGEVRYDATRVAQISTKAAGTAWRVDKQLGDVVRPGEVLALVDAGEVGRLKSELLAALADANLRETALRRTEGLAAQGIAASRVKEEAQAEWSRAKTRLLAAEQALNNLGLTVSRASLSGQSEDELAARIRLLGLPQALRSELESSTTTSNLIPVTSPLGGVVVAREVVAGEFVDTGRVLFKVADTSRLWLLVNVPVEAAVFVVSGQVVQFRADGATDEVRGVVTWVSTAVDDRTRTVQVCAELSNDTGRLRAETFGIGRITLRQEPEAVVVPNDALQWDGSCHIVFVRDRAYFEEGAPKFFHTRPVRVGVRSGDVTEIIAGVVPNEVVATKGSGVLRAQLLRNSIGAG